MKTYAGIGSRNTPSQILRTMEQFARDAAGWTLRSGAAYGADSAFERGAELTEIWLPWRGYNSHVSQSIVTPAAIAMAAKFHPAWDRCSQGVRKLHGRNMHIILGDDLQTPVNFVVCWTVDGAITGGTGVALRCAIQHSIPIFNLALPGHLDAARGFTHN